MPKKYRLSGPEIRSLSRPNGGQAGKRLHGKFFSLLFAPIQADHPKCACVASKKVSHKAPARNTIKRHCRLVLATSIVGVERPCALVFYAKTTAKDASFADVKRDIEELLAKVR